MSPKPIYIPEPCKADLSSMPKCEKGLYCSVCDKHVLDLRQMSRQQVSRVLEQNSEACVAMNARHVSGKKAWGWAENFAEFMRRNKFSKAAAVFLALCLLLASCKPRRLAGAYSKTPGPQQKTEQL